ncbi:hypothetical protein [Ruania alba]|uniref:Uncharacterized protein n=1 Tax=Ruania alba TaxID=648782 RepID=A0A1H5N4J1_9MICO|nr:hypothetical protein [Ruania alba]SEE95837.1 hypothetical protein SAMN04488554_3879 [Ruania alba]
MSAPSSARGTASGRLGLAVGLLGGGVLVLAVALGAPSLSTDRSGLSALIVAVFLGLVAATAGVWAYGLGRVARMVAVVLGVLGAVWCALAV